MKYQYIIFGSSSEFMRASYADIENCDMAKYLYRNIETNSKILNSLYRIHNSKKINSLVCLPGKSLWFNALIPELDRNMTICFVFFAGGTRFAAINDGFIEFLRSRFPKSRYVCFYQDLVSLKRPVDIEAVKAKFDAVLSFDQSDCKKYGLIYYQLVYSACKVENCQIVNDVYFVGKAKDRIDEILNVYGFLREAGLKCDFNIVGAAPHEQRYTSEINYCEPMPYNENIKHILSSKSILEIMQHNGSGYTLRTCEAIANDRLLITNNPEMKNAPFFHQDRIIAFSKISEINTDAIKNATVPVDHNYKNELSPIKLLEFIDNLL